MNQFYFWSGNYSKQFYDVMLNDQGWTVVLACWPNAGKMVASDGTGRIFDPEDIKAIRVSDFQEGVSIKHFDK